MGSRQEEKDDHNLSGFDDVAIRLISFMQRSIGVHRGERARGRQRSTLAGHPHLARSHRPVDRVPSRTRALAAADSTLESQQSLFQVVQRGSGVWIRWQADLV